MDSPPPGSSSRDRGLPPGVEIAPLGPRFIAYLIDLLVPAAAGTLVGVLLPGLSNTGRLALGIACAIAVLGWVILVWFLLAQRAASPGMRLMKLQLVGYYDGRPIGWGRVLVRAVVLSLLQVSGLGLIIMLVLMVLHPRHQGWHDQVAKAVMIKERVLAPRHPPSVGPAEQRPAVGTEPAPAPSPVAYGAQARYSPVPGPAPSPPPLTPPPGVGGYPAPGPYAPGPPPQSAPVYPPQSVPVYPQQPTPAYSPQSAPSAPPIPPGPVPGSEPAPVEAPPMPSPAQTAPRGTTSPPAYAPATPPAEPQGWVAVLDDGQRIALDGLVLLGRNPQPQPGEEDAQLIKLADETRTVSKSHLGIGVDAGGVYVVDRGSTNGSTVTTTSGQSTRCTPGVRVYVGAGTIVSIGDHWLEIRPG